MLRVVQSSSSGQAKRYYTDGLEQGDYYLGDAERPGIWGGKGALLLGLTGHVERAAFHRLCENEKPDGGKLTARTKANRRVGYDFNFHAPKGVSVVQALLGDERLVDAVVAAAAKAMQRMETEAEARVRVGRANSDRTTGNLIWAAFPHLTTRPVDGVPDPHLHVHCYVFNATFDAVEGKWKAGEFGHLKKNAPFFEAYFHAALMKSVGDLGYAVEGDGRRWDLAALPTGFIEKFSRRTAEIEAVAEAKGIKDIDAKAALGAKTRRSKGSSLPHAVVRANWEKRLTDGEHGFIDSLRASATSEAERRATHERFSARGVIDHALDQCFQRLSVATERQVLAAGLRLGKGEVEEAALKSELATRSLLKKEAARDTLVSLPSVLADEKRLLEFARVGRGACAAPAPAFLSSLPDAASRLAVEHVFRSRDRVTLVRTRANSEAVIRETFDGLRTQGQEVAVAATSPSTLAALEKHGVPCVSLHALLGSAGGPASRSHSTFLVAGANTLGAEDAARLLGRLDPMKGRLVLFGDSRRPSNVGRGDVMQLLERLAGLETPGKARAKTSLGSIKEVRSHVASGDWTGAIRSLQQLGHIGPTESQRGYPGVTKAFVEGVRLKNRCVVLTNNRDEALRVTAHLREALRSFRLLKGKAVPFQALDAVYGTMDERRQAAFYRPGQVVQFYQHVKGFKAGSRYTVVGHDPFGNVLARYGLFVEALPLSHPERFQAFSPRDISLSRGDLVRVTKNSFAKSRPFFPGILGRPNHHRLVAGSIHQVKSISRDGIRLGNGIVVPHDFGHLDHGYCLQAGSVAGRKFDRVLLVATDAKDASQQGAPLRAAASAAKRVLHVFADDIPSLLASIAQGRRTDPVMPPQPSPDSRRPVPRPHSLTPERNR